MLPAGAFCYCFPHIIEGVHPHRQGEEEIISSIRSGAAILGLLGVLYTYTGWSNAQVRGAARVRCCRGTLISAELMSGVPLSCALHGIIPSIFYTHVAHCRFFWLVLNGTGHLISPDIVGRMGRIHTCLCRLVSMALCAGLHVQSPGEQDYGNTTPVLLLPLWTHIPV